MKAALSFFSLFIGWCFAIAALVCWQVFGPGFHYVTDFGFFLFWPAVFSSIGWLVFVLPAICIVSEQHRLMQFPAMIVTGAAYGLAVYLILVCTWLTDGWRLMWFPAIMGGGGGTVYSLLLRSSVLKSSRRLSWIGLFIAPLVIVLLFAFVVWPLVIRRLPYVAYTFGAYESRDEAHFQILKRIRKGDTFAELHRKYPRIFDEPALGMSGGGSRYSYRISFDETRTYIDEIEISETK